MSWVALVVAVVVVLWPRACRPRRLASWSLPALPRRHLSLGAGGVAVAAALSVGGPVAGVVVAAYAWLGAREAARRRSARRAAANRAAALDGLCSVVADLRAGIPVGVVGGDGRLAGLTGAVWRLAEQTGAPAADLLDRIESDARASDRAARAAAAQAAGAQATAMLLAGLPLGGIALGYAIGADPLYVLFRTPVGEGCAVAAVALQCAGLRWAGHLVDGPVP
ncbi:hypothetical protein AB0M02_37365 [Actinoplanes sp. NPDC051861]|uniref:hypothetical protein n=1 Tax=Actinoplanes sp. NPDC051861 TaxID=3155170 RepID=UPI00343957EC